MRTCLSYSILFLMFLSGKLFAQDVRVQAHLDKKEYLIGDYIRLQIQITNTGNAVVQLPLMDSIAPAFEIINATPVDTITGNNLLQYNEEIVYTLYDSGLYKINPIKVFYKRQNDTVNYLVTSDTIRFLVNTIPVDTTQTIKPIKDIIPVETKNYVWLYILAGIVLLIIIIFSINRIFFNKKLKPIVIKKPVVISLYDNTIRKLHELDEKKLWQKDAVKQYYIELTDIIREYIEQRYHLPAMENTSDEIIESLVRTGIGAEQINHISTVLRYADLAKFAKSKPLPAENSLAMQYAKEFVDVTKIKEEENKEPK
ncbi:MAG: hypothetical protein H7Y00_12940 [Fimbriimonadaceae bacterium]|nr:hypothetical protein [Chitinophagales bacterium]